VQAVAPRIASHLILASSSPRRRELLAQIGVVPAEVVAPEIDETPRAEETPREYVRRIARTKAERSGAVTPPPGHALLACDTTVALGRRILGKPTDRADAARMLALLSGRRHHVWSAVVLRRPDGSLSERLVDSTVAFCRLTDAQSSTYLDTGEWQGKAGGYAVQGHAAAFVRFISGSYSNVVGLPLFETAQLLRSCGLLA